MFGRGARLAGLAAVFGLAALLAPAPDNGTAAAYDPPAGTVEYEIHHSKYDRIGTHSVAFSRAGDDLIVSTVIHIKVKVLFITAYTLESERREVWRGGRLVSYTSRTRENGEPIDVNAELKDGVLVINGSNGTMQADGMVFPTHPWHPEIVDRALLMDTQTGELLKVSTRPDGEEAVEVAGKPVPARRYVMSGDIERELWFDGSGNWIRMRFKRDGATLTFTRTTPLS